MVGLKALLEPFGIYPPKIKRKHLTLRTRVQRLAKPIGFAKLEWLHGIVIGLFINRYEFGRLI